eukprot:3563236-Amphidinium_carterae.1
MASVAAWSAAPASLKLYYFMPKHSIFTLNITWGKGLHTRFICSTGLVRVDCLSSSASRHGAPASA